MLLIRGIAAGASYFSRHAKRSRIYRVCCILGASRKIAKIEKMGLRSGTARDCRDYNLQVLEMRVLHFVWQEGVPSGITFAHGRNVRQL
jgi:hypothetical protein